MSAHMRHLIPQSLQNRQRDKPAARARDPERRLDQTATEADVLDASSREVEDQRCRTLLVQELDLGLVQENRDMLQVLVLVQEHIRELELQGHRLEQLQMSAVLLALALELERVLESKEAQLDRQESS